MVIIAVVIPNDKYELFIVFLTTLPAAHDAIQIIITASIRLHTDTTFEKMFPYM